MRPDYSRAFDELREGAEKCNNVSALRSFADKANALKIRFLNEMDALDANIAAQLKEGDGNTGRQADEPEPVLRTSGPMRGPKKVKNISMRNIVLTSHWRLESRNDVEQVIEDLKYTLFVELEENDVVNVEF